MHRVVAGNGQGSGAGTWRVRGVKWMGEDTAKTGVNGITVRKIEAEISASNRGMREIYLQRCAAIVLNK